MWIIAIPIIAFAVWYIPNAIKVKANQTAFSTKFRADGKAGRLPPQEQVRYDAMYGKGN